MPRPTEAARRVAPWRLGAIAALAAVVPPVAGQAADGGAAGKGGFVQQEQEQLPAHAQEVLALVNAQRAAGARCGGNEMAPARPLGWSAALERAADLQVRDMAQRGTVGHQGSDGSSVGQRVERQGYAWSTVGENAAAGNGTLAGTLRQWMNSAGHCRNLMSSDFRELGVVGLRMPGTRYEWYWIMVLAAPAGRP